MHRSPPPRSARVEGSIAALCPRSALRRLRARTPLSAATKLAVHAP